MRSMVNFTDGGGRSGSNRLTLCQFDENESQEEELDEFYHQPEKKRRLTSGQVQFLEKSFEVDYKLEPDRKTHLAKEIGLEPRQVAVWFQNRRARWKTMQLEKDFEVLQSNHDTLKADYENLLDEKDKLKAQVLHLSEKLLFITKENANLEQSEEPLRSEMEKTHSKDEEDSSGLNLGCTTEDVKRSAKSDIFDSYRSDISNEEENSLDNSMFPSYIFSKLRDFDYSDQPTSSCNFEFHVEDNALLTWS